MRIRAILLGLLLAAASLFGSVRVLETKPPAVAQADASAEYPFPISADWPEGVQRFLRDETSPLVFNVLYRYGEVRPNANGAYGPNTSASPSAWYVEYQRAGATDIISGVLHRRSSLIAEGLRMFEFAAEREASNGSFPGSAWPFHGTAMYLAEAAPALIVLKYSTLASSFRASLARQTRLMRRAARHLIRVVHGVGKIDDATKDHRWFEAAMALGATGVLSGDSTLVSWSRVYARRGMGMSRSDGVMPENWGHDTGYQALGMVHAARYVQLVAAGMLRSDLLSVLGRAESWEMSRIGPDGTVDQSGDTRTSACRERDPAGKCKTTFFALIFSALARWSAISGSLAYERAAYWVWLQNWRLVSGDLLPPPGLGATPAALRAGEWLTVWGTRFQPLETVRVYIGGRLMQTVQADQIGSFGAHSPQPNAHFPLRNFPSGDYTVVARGEFGTVRKTTIHVAG